MPNILYSTKVAATGGRNGSIRSDDGLLDLNLALPRTLGGKGDATKDSAVFDVRFWRSYRMLRFIACRVLGGPEHANKAVENCWHTASRRAPRFEHEGEFRRWLLRALIDEALALLRNSQQTPKPGVLSEPLPVEVFSGNDVLREQH